MEAFSEFVKKSLELVLLRNCLTDFQQRLELSAGRIEGRRKMRFRGRVLRFRHENENSTRFGGVTTKGKAWSRRAVCVYSGPIYGGAFVPANYPALRESLPGYMHEDFQETSGSSEEAMEAFLSETSEEEIQPVREEWQGCANSLPGGR